VLPEPKSGQHVYSRPLTASRPAPIMSAAATPPGQELTEGRETCLAQQHFTTEVALMQAGAAHLRRSTP